MKEVKNVIICITFSHLCKGNFFLICVRLHIHTCICKYVYIHTHVDTYIYTGRFWKEVQKTVTCGASGKVN